MTNGRLGKKLSSWGEVYRKWLRRGFDHGYAAYRADLWEQGKKARDLE